MSYQNVGRPRFYINILEYLGAVRIAEIDDVYRLNPYVMKSGAETTTTVPAGIFTDKGYVAFLGHSRGDLNFNSDYTNTVSVNAKLNAMEGVDVLNSLDPEFPGFSIAGFDGTSQDTITTYSENSIGSIVVGNYYDMPHSPDLSLKLNYEMDGVKNIDTIGGATISNATYTHPPNWGSHGAWQLGDADGNPISNIRSGRRSWDLSFSYLSDSSIMPSMGMQNNEASDVDDILSSNDFFSQCWNRTIGGHLPFIFQPDNTNFEQDQFAICRFDMKSLKYSQVADKLYSVSLKIRESW